MAVRIEEFHSARPYAEPEFIRVEDAKGGLPRAPRTLRFAERYIRKELTRDRVNIDAVTGRAQIGKRFQLKGD